MIEPPTGVPSDDKHGESISTITSQDPPPPLPELCARIHKKLESFLSAEPRNERTRAVQAQSRISLKVIEEALQKYSLDELSISYNGGKDCLVLLILYLSALHAHYGHEPKPSANDVNHASITSTSTPPNLPEVLRSVYIITRDPFQAVDDFVNKSLKQYHLKLARFAKPMREAFADYLEEVPPAKAIFVGTRRTDPHGENLTFFDPTDRGWPDFMRIHPVIDWHYAEIWTFIRELGIEYCPLYDMGYTSLGGTTDTHPNPALAVPGDGDGGTEVPHGERWAGEGKYRPAYELVEDEAERLGRYG